MALQLGRLRRGFQHSARRGLQGKIWKASSSEENNRVSHRLFRQLSTSITGPETAAERSCWWLRKVNWRCAGARESQPADRPQRCLGKGHPSLPREAQRPGWSGDPAPALPHQGDAGIAPACFSEQERDHPNLAGGKQDSVVSWEDRRLTEGVLPQHLRD